MIIGVQYERTPNPRPEDWDRDLHQIAQMGMSVIRTWMYWRQVNPAPGKWTWDHYDRLFELAHRHSLRVQIQLFCEAPPDYLIRQHPEWAYVDALGRIDRYYRRPAQQVGGFQGFDYCHPEARASATDYITRVAERYRDHPALFGYDVWNELWMSQWLDSPHSRAARREFLEERYGSLAGLNAAWCQQYTDWDQAKDPRQSTPLGLKQTMEGLHVDNVDMIAFQNHIRAWHMRWRCEAVRAADPLRPAMAHVGGGDTALRFDTWDTAQATDIWGVSEHAPDLETYALSCHAAAATAGGKPWWLAENSSGRMGFGLQAGQRSAAFLRSTHVLALMHGATANIFWQYRPETFGQESPNFGLVGLDGEHTERSKCASELVHMHRQHARVLDALALDPPGIGLVFSPRCLAFQEVEKRDHLWQNLLGWYFALCHQGLMPELLKDEILAKEGIPATIRGLVAPMQLIEGPGLSDRLEAWVRAGGTLVGGPFFELYDHSLYAQRRCPGTELFGVHHSDFVQCKDAVLTCIADTREAHTLPAGGVIEQLVLDDALPLAVWGAHVAAAVRRLGSGRAVYVGCQPGLGYDPVLAPQLGVFASAVCSGAGVSPPVRATGGCIFRRARSPQGRVLLLVNPHEMDLAVWIEGQDLTSRATDLLTEQDFTFPANEESAGPVPIGAQDARILLFRQR